MICIQTPRVNAGTLDQRLQPLILCPLQHLQPLLDEDPVLPGQVHHIAHCRDGDVLHKIVHVLGISLHDIVKCLDQLVGDRCAAESFEWILTVRPVWIHHSVRAGKHVLFFSVHLHIGDLMVVRDDHSQAVLLPVCDLICSRDPIVTGDDRVHAVV